MAAEENGVSTLPDGVPCPIHDGSKTCDCHGESKSARPDPRKKGIWELVRGVWTAPDGRQKKTPAQLRKRKIDLLEMHVYCQACQKGFDDYRQVELAHRSGKGNGGAFRDDSDANTTLLHFGANRAQGSMPLDVYIREKWKPEHCNG